MSAHWFSDPRDSDAEVRKERVKLLANALNATGVALLVGSLVAPFIDPLRAFSLLRTLLGCGLGGVLILSAIIVLRYMKIRE